MQTLKPDDFEPWVGKRVRVNTAPSQVEVTLTRVWRKPVSLLDIREPFALFFESSFDVYLLDTSYEFECGRGGPHTIFISQLQPGLDKRTYQAVFN